MARSEAPGRSPLALRLIHAAVFLGFAAVAVRAALPEWQHGLFALGRPYHVGTPPLPLLLLGSLLAAAGALGVLVALARRRSAPLVASWLVLGGLGAVLLGSAGQTPPARTSEIAANTTLIQVGQRVQLTMVDQLQSRGEVPVAREPWQQALTAASVAMPQVRTRGFQPVSPQIIEVKEPGARPEPLHPGSLLLTVSPDGASFEISLVGLQEGQPVVLEDETGAPVVLRGLYNPNLPAAPQD